MRITKSKAMNVLNDIRIMSENFISCDDYITDDEYEKFIKNIDFLANYIRQQKENSKLETLYNSHTNVCCKCGCNLYSNLPLGEAFVLDNDGNFYCSSSCEFNS